jgi:hypothetical protein
VTDPEPAAEERVDVRDLFDREKARELKRRRQRELAQALAGPEPEPAASEPDLDELVDKVSERLLRRLGEPDPGFFELVLLDKQAKRSALQGALRRRA